MITSVGSSRLGDDRRSDLNTFWMQGGSFYTVKTWLLSIHPRVIPHKQQTWRIACDDK